MSMMQPIRLRAILSAAFAGLLALTLPAAAQAQQVVRVDVGSATAQALTLPRGESAVIELPVDARDVLVSNPSVADAVLQSPRRIVLMGLAPGVTDALFFDAAGRQILTLNVRVGAPTSGEAALGLGLPLTRQFVEAHGGTVELVSAPGEGTAVTLTIPRAPI